MQDQCLVQLLHVAHWEKTELFLQWPLVQWFLFGVQLQLLRLFLQQEQGQLPQQEQEQLPQQGQEQLPQQEQGQLPQQEQGQLNHQGEFLRRQVTIRQFLRVREFRQPLQYEKRFHRPLLKLLLRLCLFR